MHEYTIMLLPFYYNLLRYMTYLMLFLNHTLLCLSSLSPQRYYIQGVLVCIMYIVFLPVAIEYEDALENTCTILV